MCAWHALRHSYFAVAAAAAADACLTQRSRQHFHASVEHILLPLWDNDIGEFALFGNFSQKRKILFAFFNDLIYTIERTRCQYVCRLH